MNNFVSINNISQLHQLFSLDKPRHPLISIIKNENVSYPADFGKYRYIFDLYVIAFKSGVSGTCGYGRSSYDFEEGTILFTSPGQVITIGESQKQADTTEGWTIFFHPDLIRKSPLGNSINSYSFFSYDIQEALHLSNTEKETLTELVQKIRQEYNHEIDRYTQKLIISNIELLLDYCTRYFDRQFYTRTNLNKDVVGKFEKYIKEYFESDKLAVSGIPTVQYIGSQLAISPNYLSDLLKKETGRNTQEHIHFYLIEKAKTILLNSVGSVSEIAYELGFQYPQHFSKIFKNKTGMSPKDFRSLN